MRSDADRCAVNCRFDDAIDARAAVPRVNIGDRDCRGMRTAQSIIVIRNRPRLPVNFPLRAA